MITRLEEILAAGGPDAEFIRYIMARWSRCISNDQISHWRTMSAWMLGEASLAKADKDEALAAEFFCLSYLAHQRSLVEPMHA